MGDAITSVGFKERRPSSIVVGVVQEDHVVIALVVVTAVVVVEAALRAAREAFSSVKLQSEGGRR